MTETPRFTPAQVRAQLSEAGCESQLRYAQPLAEFLTLLAKWNRVYNLTGFRDARRLLDRVLVECLMLSRWLAGIEIADVGSGAGLPGLPLAITEPERRFTLIESRAKRVHFLRHVVGELGLQNVSIEHTRAEDLTGTPSFATVLARAVAVPAEFPGLVRHLTHAGSRIVLVTSQEKSATLEPASDLSGFRLQEVVAFGPEGGFGVVVHLERFV